MEYIVSARKYRPLTFDAVVGQTMLTTTLKNAIKTGKLAHAYLFSGPRGVGKTTCARIFARTINCEHLTADGEACGCCENCKASTEQRSYNIFELDAASNNGVDDIRQLTEQIHIPPQIGRYKVFIIDEVHMLSSQAFNAFLKSLEEPPAHVVFILATTEKNKILPTILSRCQVYDFERITIQDTIAHLRMVAAKEGVTADDEALAVIAEKADGAMRDALSIFDQVASYCQGNITYAATIEDLNVLDVDNYFRIVDLALSNNVPDIMLLLNNVIAHGFDPGNLCQGLARHVRNVMMAREAKTAALLEMSEQHKARYAEQATKCTPRFLYATLKILNSCEQAYRQSANKRLLVELTLIEIAQLTQGDDDNPAAGRQPQHVEPSERKKTSVGQQKTTAAPTPPTPSSVGAKTEEKPTESAPHKLSNIGFTFANATETATQNAAPTVAEGSAAPSGAPLAETFTQEMVAREWLAMCNKMASSTAQKGLALRMKNLSPQIKEYPAIEVIVENSLLLADLQSMREQIETALRSALKNNKLTLTLRLAAPTEVKPLPSKPELLEEMKKNNTAVAALCDSFHLVIE